MACHFIGDFGLQTGWLGENKGKSWEVNFYHAAVYTAVFVIFAEFSLLASIVLLVTHFFIDPLSARWNIVKHIWIDQTLHFLVLAVIVVLKI
jgi:hypothetical protein